MASFPSVPTKGPARNKLGRGQVVTPASAAVVVTSLNDTAVLTFAVPVIVTGPLSFSVPSKVFVSQVQISTTVVQIKYVTPILLAAYSWASGDPNLRTSQGGSNNSVAGVF